MPASMMSEVAGSRPRVIGNSIAMVAVGPMPGSTPTSVPRRQPRKQNIRLCGCSVMERPRYRFDTRSISANSEDWPRPGLYSGAEHAKWQAKSDAEDKDAEDREADRQGDCSEEGHAPAGEGGDEGGDEQNGCYSERSYQQ